MLSAKDVRNIAFSKQVNGYRREEVDVFLDKVESDYEAYERTVRELNAKIHELEAQIDETRNAEGSLQSVLISAQKLADSIVAEAKEKSGKIVEEAKLSLEGFKLREKELSDAFDKKAQERKQIARDELDKIIDEAKVNHDKVSEATEKTVRKQAELFNRLKLETAAFKAEIMEKYKRQVELISRIPDSIPTDPEDIAAAVKLDVTDLSDREGFINSLEQKEAKPPVEESAEDDIDIIEDIISSSASAEETPAPQKSTGFTVNAFMDDEDN
ncbi:MAG: DivIVA domain-containing protein [Clostridia bacterium]|nr:DivIVA domain-containing protein [Clostridia bacterium]